jgi:anaerobic selenocysteine-containing dehydrogenase
MKLEPTMRTATRTCPLCEATCGLSITLDGDRVLRTAGDELDVFSRGYMCPKGATLGELYDDPDWLHGPVVRDGDSFRSVDWDTAFARVDELFAPFRGRGKDSVTATFMGNPGAHNLAGSLYSRVVVRGLGSPFFFTSGTVDHRPKELVSALLYGSMQTLAVPDIDRTDFLVLLGANPYESNGSLATAPGWPRRLEALRERGGEVVVVDPVRTRTAENADWHIRPRVGSDAALLMSVAFVLFDEGLVDLKDAGGVVVGVDELAAIARGFSPESTSAFTGVSPDAVRELARRLSAAPRAVVYGRIGTTATEFGSIGSWLIDAINILTGNLDRPGGAMFPMPAAGCANTRGESKVGPGFRPARFHSRVRGAPEIFGELPLSCLAEEILTPGAGKYRGMVVIGGNPVVSGPSSEAMSTAFASLDALVCIDPYINDTTRHADVILPPPSPLQRSHFDTYFYTWAVRNVANYSEPVLPLRPGQLDEWEIMCRLASALDGSGRSAREVDDQLALDMIAERSRHPDDAYYDLSPHEVLASLEASAGPERLLDLMLKSGPYRDSSRAVSLADLLANPHGVDLGPLEPRLPEVLRTPDGQINLAPDILVEDVSRLAEAVTDGTGTGLRLIGRRQMRSNNSWMHNVPSLMTGKDRSTLYLSPADAETRRIDDGQLVRVSSSLSSVTAVAEVNVRLPEGVCSLPHGFLHQPDAVALSTARARPGVNTNRLTPDNVLDVPSWTAAFNGLRVEVTPVDKTPEATRR